MRRFIAGIAVLVAFGFASAMPADDPDGIEQVMFHDDGSVRTDPFVSISTP